MIITSPGYCPPTEAAWRDKLMSQWLAISIVVIVGALLIYWHWSGTQVLSRPTRPKSHTGDGGFAGIGGHSSSCDASDGGCGDGGGDGGGGH
jgi:hypothetical protein